MYYTSSSSGRYQLLLSRDRELFLRIARTGRVAFAEYSIGYRLFLLKLVSHREDERQEGKNAKILSIGMQSGQDRFRFLNRFFFCPFIAVFMNNEL